MLLQLAFVLIAIIIGARIGGIGLGVLGGLGDVGGERGNGVSLRRFAGWPGASDGGESAG